MHGKHESRGSYEYRPLSAPTETQWWQLPPPLGTGCIGCNFGTSDKGFLWTLGHALCL